METCSVFLLTYFIPSVHPQYICSRCRTPQDSERAITHERGWWREGNLSLNRFISQSTTSSPGIRICPSWLMTTERSIQNRLEMQN